MDVFWVLFSRINSFPGSWKYIYIYIFYLLLNTAFQTRLFIIPSVLQVLCLLTGKKWPISFQLSPSAQLSPSTWRWSTFFLRTTTQATWTASSCGLRLVRGVGRWFLIGCSTKSWTASSLVVPSHSRGGKCWFSDALLLYLYLVKAVYSVSSHTRFVTK